LSATKNICKIFPELEKLLINTYKLGWLDFNTSIFMYYFYETTYVQNVVREFEQVSPLTLILLFCVCSHIQAVLKKNGPRYNFAIDDPNEKKYTGNKMALKTLQTSVNI
jgi:hypothetical protein